MRVKNLIVALRGKQSASGGARTLRVPAACMAAALAALAAPCAASQAVAGPQPETRRTDLPPRVVQAERFLAQRGWTPGHPLPAKAFTARTARVSAEANANAEATTNANANTSTA